MPHITVEYSANLEERLGIDALIGALHDAAIATGLFEIGGIRTRGSRRDHYRIADANPLNGFVAITVRIGHGRTLEQRRALGEALFAAASRQLDALFAATPLALSLEVQEIDPVLNFKRNNLHARIGGRSKPHEDAA